MSQIPPSKRSKSDLKAQSFCYEIRKRITTELMASFGYSQRRIDAHIRKITAWMPEDQRKETAAHLRQVEKDFDMWFIQQERIRILTFCSDISCHMRAANTIWPEYWPEFYERRLEWGRALESCNMLQDELQYIAETLPADKNKFMKIVLDVDALFKMIKSLRQADNRFKKHLKGTPDGDTSRGTPYHASNFANCNGTGNSNYHGASTSNGVRPDSTDSQHGPGAE